MAYSMKQISSLTYLVVAFPEIGNINSDTCVDWAMEMVELGYDSPYLFMLAGITKPTNYSEIEIYLKETLRELGISKKTGEDAINSCFVYYVHELAQSKDIRANLYRMVELGQAAGYSTGERNFLDFYLIYWAWGDLDYGMSYQSYWPEATLDNIERITVLRAKQWLAENDES